MSIRLLDLRTRKVRQLAATKIPPRQLSWTLDGRSILFGDSYELERLDVATGEAVALGAGEGFRPVVSPDGTRVAFLDYRDDRYYRDPDAWGIFVSALDGSNVRRITSNDKFGPRSWSPDQSTLAASDGYRLELVDVASGTRRPLLGAGYTTEAAFAPTSGPAP
jgi:Tol biopolymer transport system component